MNVGLFLPYEEPPASFAPLAEDLGFDYLAYGEHVLFRRPIHNAFVALAAASAVTTRIRLLSALTLLPLYPPALAAKLVTSIGAVSAGRFDLGVGVGGEVPEEFEACGVELAARGSRADDGIRTVRAFFDDDRMMPKPAVPPRIWVGGRSDRAIRRANELGEVWFPYLVTAEQLEAGVRKLDGPEASVACFVGVGITLTAAAQFVGDLYGMPPAQVSKYVIAGDPDDVVNGLAEFEAAGATSVILNLCARGAEAITMAQLAGSEVRPALSRAVQ